MFRIETPGVDPLYRRILLTGVACFFVGLAGFGVVALNQSPARERIANVGIVIVLAAGTIVACCVVSLFVLAVVKEIRRRFGDNWD
jgi:hypothetical protein